MKPQTGLALKGEAVEEWTDVHFFRPLGYRVARALERTSASADQVTLWCLVTGLVAGHLFLYANRWLDLTGVALLIASDVLDSADGQLARLRGTSSRFGRVLDGIADGLRFVNLYAHLMARLYLAGFGWPSAVLAAAALISHALQSPVVDFIKNAYLRVAAGGAGEVDLVEDLPAAGSGRPLQRLAARLYRDYVRRQEFLFPGSVRLLRLIGRLAPAPEFCASYAQRQGPVLPWLALIAQNIRFALLFAAVVLGHLSWFLWAAVGPLNLVMIAVILTHEYNAGALADEYRALVKVPARVG